MKILFSVILALEVLGFLSDTLFQMICDRHVQYSPVGDALVYGLLAAIVCFITILIIDYSLVASISLFAAPFAVYYLVWRILK